jgi:hypothetical protein
MINNIKIGNLPENTNPDMTIMNVVSDGTTTYKTSLGDMASSMTETIRNYKTYRAILNHTDPLDGDNIFAFGEGFIIGETYYIDTFNVGDDFSNIANVIDGDIFSDGCTFIATGTTPTNWSNNSYLYSDGNFVINVLENTTGIDILWFDSPFGGEGYYYVIGADLMAEEQIPLSSLGKVFTTITQTAPPICCYSSNISFQSQYKPVLDGGPIGSDSVFVVTSNNFDWTRGLMWNTSFEIQIFPNEYTIEYPINIGGGLSKQQRTRKLKLDSDTGTTETKIQTLIKNYNPEKTDNVKYIKNKIKNQLRAKSLSLKQSIKKSSDESQSPEIIR